MTCLIWLRLMLMSSIHHGGSEMVIVSLLCSTHPHRYQRFLQDLQEIETISFHETHARL